MGMPVQKRRYSIEEYYALENKSEEKHEYRDGEIIAMAGGTANHSLISVNLTAELRAALKGRPCKTFESNLRIRVMGAARSAYPDASVFCGPIQFDPSDPVNHTATNPLAIFEVLSPSTERYDRGEKFARYLQLESLEEYVLVNQNSARVETYFRQPGGTWLFSAVSGLAEKVRLKSLQVELSLAEIYANVSFSQEADAATEI